MHGVSSGWFNEVDPIDLLEINKVSKLGGSNRLGWYTHSHHISEP